MFGSTSWSKY